jgi:hypothetical protein
MVDVVYCIPVYIHKPPTQCVTGAVSPEAKLQGRGV